jgi:hypothetical protein
MSHRHLSARERFAIEQLLLLSLGYREIGRRVHGRAGSAEGRPGTVMMTPVCGVRLDRFDGDGRRIS